MAQPPSIPPSGGNPEVEALNQLTLQVYQLNQNIETFQIVFDVDLMVYGFLVVVLFFFLGFSLSNVIGFMRNMVNLIR